MNSLILISPYKGGGFKPILSSKRTTTKLVDKQIVINPVFEHIYSSISPIFLL